MMCDTSPTPSIDAPFPGMVFAVMTPDRYRAFGQREARGQSPSYERLAFAVADDAELLELLDELPEQKRQPNLFFGAARYLGAPMDDPDAFRVWVLRCRTELTATMNQRRTQTNEPGRCAALLPLLARLPQPLALLEVGASAGLCLYPDRYGYDYEGHLLRRLYAAHANATNANERADKIAHSTPPPR